QRVVRVSLAHVAEAMVVTLPGCGAAGGQYVLFVDQRLDRTAHVVASRIERLDVRRTGGGEHAIVHRAPIAILDGGSGGEERRTPIASVPEDARPHHATNVRGKVGPLIVIAINLGLSMAAAEE